MCCYRTTKHCCRLSFRRPVLGGCTWRPHALFGLRSVAGQLVDCQKVGHACGHVRRNCGLSHCSLRSCSLSRGGRDPLSNHLGVHHGVSVPRSSSTLHSQIGSIFVGRLACTVCVTQTLELPGRRCRFFFRTRTWGRWHLGRVNVVIDMVGSKDRSRTALAKGSGAQLSLGSTLCRCARHWLLL